MTFDIATYIILVLLNFQSSVVDQRRKKGITPTLPPPEERAEIRRKMDEQKRIFREKQREIRLEYFEKKKAENDKEKKS